MDRTKGVWVFDAESAAIIPTGLVWGGSWGKVEDDEWLQVPPLGKWWGFLQEITRRVGKWSGGKLGGREIGEEWNVEVRQRGIDGAIEVCIGIAWNGIEIHVLGRIGCHGNWEVHDTGREYQSGFLTDWYIIFGPECSVGEIHRDTVENYKECAIDYWVCEVD